MIEVELPNGVIAEFPDGTPKAVMQRAISAKFGQRTPNQRVDAAFDAVKPEATLKDTLRSGLGGVLEGVPIAGPLAKEGVQMFGAGVNSLTTGNPYEREKAEIEIDDEFARSAAPNVNMAGQVAGGVGSMALLGSTALGAKALGLTGRNLGTRTLASAGSTGAISALDAAARGGDAGDIVGAGAGGLVIGGVLPVAGEAVAAGAGAIGRRMGSAIRAATQPTKEGARRVGQAFLLDRAANPKLPGAVQEAAARRNGQQLLNVDRGGEFTRALARSAANTDPAAREKLTKLASDRFASQGSRAQNFISRITGGQTDDLLYQDVIKASARKANKPAYDRAFNSPAGQALYTQELEQLMQAPAIQAAAKQATERGANRAAAEGFKPIRNPFEFKDGTFTLKQNQDGSIAVPNLQFWDQVKRNLDGFIGTAKRSGDNALASDTIALKSQLVEALDSAVPEYQTARQGAASFFGAEDALEAGKKFVNMNRTIPETKRALAKMNSAEREAFSVGFAAELKDKIAATSDRRNVIGELFNSQQARDKIKLALGPKNYTAFEKFVKVETAMDMLRGALGNSTTARQLAELGIAGGVGGGTYAYTGGDLPASITAAALTRGARLLGGKIDERMTKSVANLLLSDDPRALQIAVRMATKSPRASAALEKISGYLANLSRGAAVSGTSLAVQGASE